MCSRKHPNSKTMPTLEITRKRLVINHKLWESMIMHELVVSDMLCVDTELEGWHHFLRNVVPLMVMAPKTHS